MKLKLTTLFLCLALTKMLSGQSVSDVSNYIDTYKDIAIREMQRTGIPASVILAQGIHETQAGTSDLVKRSNNHFGIKCKDTWTGSVVYHDDDDRGECFRSYNTPLDSYKDHSNFLLGSMRYNSLFKLNPLDYEGWANGLKKAGYATNPRYPQILIQLIKDYNLQQYTLIAMGKLPPSNENLAGTNGDKTVLPIMPGQEKKKSAASQYPAGEFLINNTKVVFVQAGTSLLGLSDQYNLPLSKLIEFNDLSEEDVLTSEQLIFLQRKRKSGDNEFHIVQEGETAYDICQAEGIRYESLLELNLLSRGEEPAAGEKIFLRSMAPAKPVLNSEKHSQPVPGYPNPVAMNAKPTSAEAITPANPFTHVVQTKETLYSISKKYGVDMEKIQKWNKLDSLDLKTGQELIIYKN